MMNIWAMRTSRDSEEHINFVKNELQNKGILRQGWGYCDEQDLNKIYDKIIAPNFNLTEFSSHEEAAFRNLKMLGKSCQYSKTYIQVGDIILVPNMPKNGFFTLCRVTGDYSYSGDTKVGDLRHMLPVEVITKGGVAYSNENVDAALRGSLRCRGRLWDINPHKDCVDKIISLVKDEKEYLLREGSDHVERAKGTVDALITTSVNNLSKTMVDELRSVLQGAEWEPVLCYVLDPLMKNIQIEHTGGPSECGADIVINIPNPFKEQYPWLIVIQVKNYKGEIGVEVAKQLIQAIDSRSGQGQVIAAYVLTTADKISGDLKKALEDIEDEYNISAECVILSQIKTIITKGMLLASLSNYSGDVLSENN